MHHYGEHMKVREVNLIKSYASGDSPMQPFDRKWLFSYTEILAVSMPQNSNRKDTFKSIS